MARITIAALQAQINEQQQRIADLEAELAHARRTIEHAVEAMEAADAELAAQRTPTARVQRAGYVQPQWQVTRAQQMAAARELAMRLKRSVKVEVAA